MLNIVYDSVLIHNLSNANMTQDWSNYLSIVSYNSMIINLLTPYTFAL